MNENTRLLKVFVNWLQTGLTTGPKGVKLLTEEIFDGVTSHSTSATFEDLGTTAEEMLHYSNLASFCLHKDDGEEIFKSHRLLTVSEAIPETLEAIPA